jgi:hypothetical protein
MWGAIEADFHREYGIDLSAPGELRRRTWRWFTTRLSHLSSDSLTRSLARKSNTPETGSAMSALRAASQR